MSTQENPHAKIIAQAWSDEDYKRRLIDDPAGALAGGTMPCCSGPNPSFL